MTPDELRFFDLVYLSSPYSRYCDGHEAAFRQVAEIAAKLLKEGVRVFCPIAHAHPISYYGDIDPADDSMWAWLDEIMIERSNALLVVQMEGWERSHGVTHEIAAFEEQQKPIFYLEPDEFEIGTAAFT